MRARGAEKAGFTTRDMVSGAGHDAAYIARVAPTTMIFVPCVGGLSATTRRNRRASRNVRPARRSCSTPFSNMTGSRVPDRSSRFRPASPAPTGSFGLRARWYWIPATCAGGWENDHARAKDNREGPQG